MNTKVMTWGLQTEEVKMLHKFVSPEEIEVLEAPPDHALSVPLLVAPQTLHALAEWADQYEEENGIRPSPVLLSLLLGEEEPTELWDSYDGIVRADNLSFLQRLIECPQVIDAQLAAMDVPSSFLSSLAKPIGLLRIAAIPFGDPDWNASDSELREHLADCVPCRRTFNETLERRITAMGQILRRARQQVQNDLTNWIEVKLNEAKHLASEKQDYQFLLALMYAFVTSKDFQKTKLLSAQMKRGVNASSPSEMVKDLVKEPTSDEREQLSENMEQLFESMEAGLTLDSTERSFSLQWKNEYLTIDALFDEDDVATFRLELWQNDKIVVEANSEDGKVILPLANLPSLQEGAVRFVIQRDMRK